MESDILHILKEIFYIVIGPIIGLFIWIGKLFHRRINSIEYKVHNLEKDNAVCQAKMLDIKEDIASIDKKIDKILDKVR